MSARSNRSVGSVLHPAQRVPVARKVDVLVVGGGTTGVAAAVAAARQGANTLLVERYGYLGGTATGAPVPFFQEGPTVRGNPVIRGIYAEVKARLARHESIRDESAAIIRRTRIAASGGYVPALLQVVCLDMCQEAGVELMLHTYLVNVLTEDGAVRHPVFVNKGGLVAVEAKQFVDATGDGDLATLAGARAEVGRPGDGLLQPVSLVFQLANIDFQKLETADWNRLIPLFEAECPEVVVARKKLAFLVTGGVLAFFIMNHVKHVNTVDPEDHTRAEIVGRRQARQVWQFLRRYVPGCEECVIAAMGTEVGVRETRRIVGDYVMTRQDILGAHKFPDAIGCSTAWIDAHHPEGISIRHEFLPRDEWFEVPYRALVTAGLTNVYTVGRCMSSTHEAQSALRVIPTLMMVGEAAGTAAALCARQGIAARELDVGLLQKSLAAAGVYLGTAQPAEAAPPTVA